MNAQHFICSSHSDYSDHSNNTSGGDDISSNAKKKGSIHYCRPEERLFFFGRHKKGVRFENVKIYLFERTQGFDVVPSSGGFALGMQKKHFGVTEVALCNKVTDDGITKSEDSKLSIKSLAEQVCTVSNRCKRKYCNSFDGNAIVTKRRRSSNGPVDQTFSTTKVTTNVNRGKSRTPEKIISTNISENASGHVDIIEENEEDNICIVKKYFRPLSRRIRLLKLKRTGFKKFVDDRAICDDIRESRKRCGCSCGTLSCSPETCECSKNGIECLVDRPSFPCTCTAISCNNPFGRREFDETVVSAHFRSILMRTQGVQNRKVCVLFLMNFLLSAFYSYTCVLQFSDFFPAIRLHFDNH
uniref:CSRNP_N domain-containing protein n=1 Tax=Elaeophora elaphi TaxID=1147741 RepID=A0A0R3RRA4_9BILA